MHDTGPGHPENSGRLVEVIAALKTCDYADQLVIKDAPMGEDEHILRAHTQTYLDIIKESVPQSGYSALDGDTTMSPDSLKAAYRAVGAACTSVDTIMAGEHSTVFCAVRPPGHHATRSRPMGFCLFNNIAIAALYALEEKGVERIAIIDFDVHHGNGTQDIVQEEGRIFYASTHQSPFYPGTGYEDEKGVGNILNIEMPAGIGSEAYRKEFSEKLIPALKVFDPELLLISAGFDSHEDDPLAQMRLDEDDFHWIGQQLHKIAQDHCSGRSISMLEGGYNHQALADSAVSYLRAFV